MKYAESLRKPAPELHARYREIAHSSGLFMTPDARSLRTAPLQQLFRLHCLSQCLLDQDLGDVGVFLFVAPRHNTLAQGAALAFSRELAEPTVRHVSFRPLTLERLIEAIDAAGERELARQLYRRYCDWWLVDGEIELALKAEAPVSKTATSTAEPATGAIVRLPVRRRAQKTKGRTRPCS